MHRATRGRLKSGSPPRRAKVTIEMTFCEYKTKRKGRTKNVRPLPAYEYRAYSLGIGIASYDFLTTGLVRASSVRLNWPSGAAFNCDSFTFT